MKAKETIKNDFNDIVLILNSCAPQKNTEVIADTMLTRFTSQAMEEKLAESRAKGKHGWWDKDVCSIEYLYSIFNRALTRNNLLGIINTAAMIYVRECAEEEQND